MERNTFEEMKAIIDALEQGKAIQWYNPINDEWDDKASNTPNFYAFRYRVKPAEPKKWRPFDGITECHDAIDRHGAWVINIHNHQHCQIVAYDKAGALVAQTTKTYKELLENFIFVNGFPCGEEET